MVTLVVEIMLFWSLLYYLNICRCDSDDPNFLANKLRYDLNATYHLLDKIGWRDTVFEHISGRINNSYYLVHSHDSFQMENTENIEITNSNQLYNWTYSLRSDVNVIFHVHNPYISAISSFDFGMLPIDQSYYPLYPIRYCNNECKNNYDLFKTILLNDINYDDNIDYKASCFVILLQNEGILLLGLNTAQTFTRLHFSIHAAQSQVYALAVHKGDIHHIIFPSTEIQKLTIKQSLNFNPSGYGLLEFDAYKRRHNFNEYLPPNQCNENNITAEQLMLRKQLSKTYIVLDRFGWTETIYQHLTLRLNNSATSTILINAYGLEFGEVNPYNLMEIELNGNVIYGGNSTRANKINPSGLVLHSAIHEYRNDANVVLHVHHPYLSAISVNKMGFIPRLSDTYFFGLLKPITYHDFDSLALALNKTQLRLNLGYESNVLILRNHGVICIGRNVKEAFDRLYYVIHAAQTQIY
eukprot:499525_1